MGSIRSLLQGSLGLLTNKGTDVSSTKAAVVEQTKTDADPIIIDGECCGGGCQSQSRENQIRELAYLKWQAATGGSPVSQQDTEAFWLEAEQELSGE